MTPRATRRLGLRARVTATFALVTLAATVLVSATAFVLSQQYLVAQRERSAVRQTFLNARLVRDLLQTRERTPQDTLDSLVGEAGTIALLEVDDEWYVSGVGADPDDLPESLLDALSEGEPARQRAELDGHPLLFIGVPLLDGAVWFVEVVPLDNLNRTLRTLSLSLIIGSAGTTFAGALIGVFVSRRLLRPLKRMSRVSADIARGADESRLDADRDPDLTELVDSFNEMVDMLQLRIEREQRFTSDVSHELRTPLTVLRTAAHVVEQRSNDLPPRTVEAVKLLVKQIDYFERLVLDLLEISRFDSGVEMVDLEELELVELVDQTAAAHAAPMADADGPVWVTTDRRRVERVLSNVIENANRYARGVRRILVTRVGDRVQVVIDDHGGGIPAQDRTRVFERFYRGRDARHLEGKGSGLGLALVAEHLRLLGGSVHICDSPEGSGRFVVEIPGANDG
jgi:two-component system, OmpR family, sensor histidine kinase MtrB